MNLESRLREAAKNGELGQARMFLMAGTNIESTDEEGWTPLMFAALGGHLELAQMLIERGADVNARSQGGFAGMTTLMIAASCGHVELVRVLLERGADVRPQGPQGGTALAFAAFYRKYDIVKLLLVAGADPRSGNYGIGVTASQSR